MIGRIEQMMAGVQVLMRRCSQMLRDWRLVNRIEDAEKLEEWAADLERSFVPPRLCWYSSHQAQEGSVHSSACISLVPSGVNVNSDVDHVIDLCVEPFFLNT
jgi:hypothetical protein